MVFIGTKGVAAEDVLDAHAGRSIQGFGSTKSLSTLLKARFASCMAVWKSWSFYVNAEFKTKTAFAVSQIAIFGPAK